MPDHYDLEVAVSVAAYKGELDLDPHVSPCPKCSGQLRCEYRNERVAMSKVTALFGVTEAEVRESGAKVDSFGRVKSAVPYATCMACGADFDMTSGRTSHDSETGEST